MNRLNELYNRLDSATCPKMIDSIVLEIEATNVNWKETAIALKEKNDKLEEAKRRGEDWLERLRRLVG